MAHLPVTKKFVRQTYPIIINVGYCELQYLLKTKSPFGYYANGYGWRCDFYEFGNVCICTGYDNMSTKKNPDISYKTCQEFEQRAKNKGAEKSPKNTNLEPIDFLIKEFIEMAKRELHINYTTN